MKDNHAALVRSLVACGIAAALCAQPALAQVVSINPTPLASAGGNVEIQSAVTYKEGAIAGTWKELVRDMSGEVTGTVTPKGFRVAVRGQSLNANMDIVLVGAKQVIEIQFIDSNLIGLTLILDKADAASRGPS